MNWKYLFMLPLLAAAMLPGVAFGDVIYNVSLDVAPLIGAPTGPFYADFQFTDGSGIGDGNNSAVVNNFHFGSGGPAGSPVTFGSVTGDLGSSITLTDNEFFNEFTQPFTPGDFLRFTVTLTSNPESIDVPDQFSFAILDSTGAGGPMLVADINSINPALLGYPSDALSLSAPTISAVPEPSSLWLLVGACCLIVGSQARSMSAARRLRLQR